MLEVEYNGWSAWRENKCRIARKEGYVLGKLIGLVDMVKSAIRRDAQYHRTLEKGETVPNYLQKMYELYTEAFEMEKLHDVIQFAMKYPMLSNEQLAKRIRWESEYWHS